MTYIFSFALYNLLEDLKWKKVDSYNRTFSGNFAYRAKQMYIHDSEIDYRENEPAGKHRKSILYGFLECKSESTSS